MGKPAPGYDVRIVDDCGMEVSEGSEGNIAVNCENSKMDGVLFDGYVGDEEKTKKAFLNNFYLTGDRGFVDQDGFIWFKSRQDDVIISAGYRIGPFEVESGTQLFTSFTQGRRKDSNGARLRRNETLPFLKNFTL